MRIPYRKPGIFSRQSPDPFLTPQKYAELAHTLERLKNQARPAAAAEVARLAELGDFSENAEYQLAKGKLRGINNHILLLENHLKQASIIQPQRQHTTVELGHVVTIESINGEKKYQILGSTETNPGQGVISHNSPVGAALMGKTIGDTVNIPLGNKEIRYTIKKIE